jgi:hypothetical protein
MITPCKKDRKGKQEKKGTNTDEFDMEDLTHSPLLKHRSTKQPKPMPRNYQQQQQQQQGEDVDGIYVAGPDPISPQH